MLVLRTIWCYNAKDRAGTGQKLPVSLLPVQSQSHCALVAQARHLLCWASPANLVLNCVLQNNSQLMLAGFKKWEAKELWLWKSQLASLGKDPRNSWKILQPRPPRPAAGHRQWFEGGWSGTRCNGPSEEAGFWTVRDLALDQDQEPVTGEVQGDGGLMREDNRTGRSARMILSDRDWWQVPRKNFCDYQDQIHLSFEKIGHKKTLLGCWWGEVTASTPFTGPSPTWRASPGFPPSTGARHGDAHDIHGTCFGDPDGLPRPFQGSPFGQFVAGGSH